MTSLTVGLPISRSGQFSLQGEQVLAGVKRWINWMNDRGGVRFDDGRQLPLELVQYDDESHPATAERLTRRLIRDDKVDILLGPYSSRLTLAAAPVADDHEMVLWNHSGATDDLYTNGSQWLVSVLAPAGRYFHGLLDLIQEIDQSETQVAVCWSSSGSFGKAVADGSTTHARRSASESGFTVVTTHTWEPPLDDTASIVDSIRDAAPDLVLVAGSFDDDVRLVRDVLALDSAPTAVGAVAAGISEFGERLSETANGVFGPSQWEPGSASPDYGPSPAAVVDLFESGQATEYPTAQAFAAGLVIERCLTVEAIDPDSGTVDQRKLRAAAEIADFTTFYGRFRIDPDTGKQVGHTPVVVQWQEDEKRVVWPEHRRHVEPRYPPRYDQ